MRYVNAEKKLQAWHQDTKERELEKVALNHIKEQARAQKREQEHKVGGCHRLFPTD